MPKPDFTEAVAKLVTEDLRYERDAYYFLRDALDHTVKQRRKSRGDAGSEHVSGQQLLDGIRVYALKQFGPMVTTVFGYWGIKQCEDFGHMVYNLIQVKVFGKTDADTLADFRGGYSFEDAFVTPYQLAKVPVHRRGMSEAAQQKLN